MRLGGHRQRVVLAVLALRANRVTSVEYLSEAVWGPKPPQTARGQIQTCVSALRRLLDKAGCPGALETRHPGYLLHLSPEQLDAARFDQLLTRAAVRTREGALGAAAADLREALALWRGAPLSDLDSDVVRGYSVVLAERHRSAKVERIRLDIELGRHAEVVAELQELVGQESLSEAPHRLLMLALQRCGRVTEALDAYRRARALFVDHLGIEPGGLAELEHAILSDTLPSAPAVPATGGTSDNGLVPRQLPTNIADFVARDAELARIVRFLDPGSRPPSAVRVVSIAGQGGVGKSVLAVRAAHACVDRFPDGQLYASLRGSTSAEVWVRLLRGLGVRSDSVPEDPQACAELYRSRLAGRRMLVVLDDAVDEAQVTDLLPGSPTCAVIVTSRPRLAGLPGACRVDLGVFDDDRSLDLLRRVVGEERVEAERGAAVQIARLCGGLPLALLIAGARLVARPHWPLVHLAHRLADENSRLDELTHAGLELRANISESHRDLSPRAALLLRLLSMIEAPAFTVWMAAALLDTQVEEAENLLESLVDAQLLSAGDERRYHVHELVRIHAKELLRADVPLAGRQTALGRLLGAWLALDD